MYASILCYHVAIFFGRGRYRILERRWGMEIRVTSCTFFSLFKKFRCTQKRGGGGGVGAGQ